MAIQKMGQVLATAVIVTAGWSHSAAIIDWNFETMTDGTTPPTPGVYVPGLSYTGSRGTWVGSGVIQDGVSSSKAYGGRGPDDAPPPKPVRKTLADAVNGDVAFYFEIIIAPGYVMSLDSIQTPWSVAADTGGGNHPLVYAQWQYQINSGGWETFGDPEPMPYNGYDWVEFDLSGVEGLQDITDSTVTFRVLFFGGDMHTRYYLGKDSQLPDPNSVYANLPSLPNTLSIWGKIVPEEVPEPSAMALIALSGAALLLRRRYNRG